MEKREQSDGILRIPSSIQNTIMTKYLNAYIFLAFGFLHIGCGDNIKYDKALLHDVASSKEFKKLVELHDEMYYLKLNEAKNRPIISDNPLKGLSEKEYVALKSRKKAQAMKFERHVKSEKLSKEEADKIRSHFFDKDILVVDAFIKKQNPKGKKLSNKQRQQMQMLREKFPELKSDELKNLLETHSSVKKMKE